MNKLTTEQLLFAHRIGAETLDPCKAFGKLQNGKWFVYSEGWIPSLLEYEENEGLSEPIDFTPLYDWIEHDGGECPVKDDDEVVVDFGDIHDGQPIFFILADSISWDDVERFKLHRDSDWPEQRADAIGQNGNDGKHCDIPPPEYDPRDVAFRSVSDGSTASYYELPPEATELQHLISYRNMNAQDGEIFRAIYRKGRASHSDALRDAKKVLFYAQAEVERLEKYGK